MGARPLGKTASEQDVLLEATLGLRAQRGKYLVQKVNLGLESDHLNQSTLSDLVHLGGWSSLACRAPFSQAHQWVEELSHLLQNLQAVGRQVLVGKDGVNPLHGLREILMGKTGPARINVIRLVLLPLRHLLHCVQALDLPRRGAWRRLLRQLWELRAEQVWGEAGT